MSSSSHLSNTQARDMASLLHPFTNLTVLRQTGPLVLDRGKGVFVYGADGKDYVEAMGGLWCTALGWGEEELVQAAMEQMRKLSFSHIFGGKSHEPAIALAEKLKEVSPFPVGKVFFANSGSEANDTQIKLHWHGAHARGQTRERKILSRGHTDKRSAYRSRQQPQELQPAVRLRGVCGPPAPLPRGRGGRERAAI